MPENIVKAGSRITLNFSLFLEQGEEIDSNFDSAPVELLLGNGDMLDSFEAVLIGAQAGESIEQLIPCEQAFGQSNEQNRQRFPRRSFDSDMELTPGLVISFADKTGAELPGVVAEVENDYVLVDFNHPLADKNIIFKARVHEVLS